MTDLIEKTNLLLGVANKADDLQGEEKSTQEETGQHREQEDGVVYGKEDAPIGRRAGRARARLSAPPNPIQSNDAGREQEAHGCKAEQKTEQGTSARQASLVNGSR